MEALSGYGSEEEERLTPSLLLPQTQRVNSAPMALTIQSTGQSAANSRLLSSIDIKNNMLMVNSKVDTVLAPIHGPHNPFRLNANVAGVKRVGMGSIENTNMEDWCFNEQYQTYQKSGYAFDVNSNAEVIGDYAEYLRNQGNVASYSKKSTAEGKRARKEEMTSASSSEGIVGDVGEEEGNGPWSGADSSKDAYQLALEAFQAKQQALESSSSSAVGETESLMNKAAKKITNKEAEEEEKEREEGVVPKSGGRMHIIEPEEQEEIWERQTERKQGFILPPRPSRGNVANEVMSNVFFFLCKP